MLTQEQKEVIRKAMMKLHPKMRLGFAKWAIRIMKTDPTAPW